MTATAATRNLPAILCLVAGIAIFSVQDLILKLLSGDYPLYQAMILRSLVAMPCMALLAVWFDGTWRSLITPNWLALLGRGMLNFLAYTAYYLALAALPMATTVALYFTAPLFITVLSVVRWRNGQREVQRLATCHPHGYWMHWEHGGT